MHLFPMDFKQVQPNFQHDPRKLQQFHGKNNGDLKAGL